MQKYNLNKELKIFFVVLLLLLVGCISLPSAKIDKKQEAVDKAKDNIVKAEDKLVDKSVPYFYAAKFSLEQDPQPNQYNDLSHNFLNKGLIITGPPAMKEVNEFEQIVTNLLSTNALLRTQGEKALSIKDNEISVLQGKIVQLEQKLEVKEQNLKESTEKVALMADTWFKIKRIFYWVVAGLVLWFLSGIISAALPPPYNSIFAIIMLPINFLVKTIFGIFPKIKELAGVVPQAVHNEAETTLKHLVKAIQEVKSKNPDVFENILSPVLKDKTSEEISRKKIEEIKASIR